MRRTQTCSAAGTVILKLCMIHIQNTSAQWQIVNRSFFPIEITSITCSFWIQVLNTNTKKTLRTPKVETCKWKVVVGPGWGRKDLGYTIRWRIMKDLTQTQRMDPSNQQTSLSLRPGSALRVYGCVMTSLFQFHNLLETTIDGHICIVILLLIPIPQI